MYYLAKKITNQNNNSVLGNPLNIVFASCDLEQIKQNISNRIKDGCSEKDLLVFERIDFKLNLEVKIND